MMATILPDAIILTKAFRAVVSMMDTLGSIIVTCELLLRSFFFLLPYYIHVYAIVMQ